MASYFGCVYFDNRNNIFFTRASPFAVIFRLIPSKLCVINLVFILYFTLHLASASHDIVTLLYSPSYSHRLQPTPYHQILNPPNSQAQYEETGLVIKLSILCLVQVVSWPWYSSICCTFWIMFSHCLVRRCQHRGLDIKSSDTRFLARSSLPSEILYKRLFLIIANENSYLSSIIATILTFNPGKV